MKKLLLTCSIALLVSAYSYAEVSGVLKGRVLDEDDLPLPGASVLITSITKGAVTDVDGFYTMTGLDEGTYEVSVSYLGYNTQTQTVTIKEGQTIRLDFKMKMLTNTLDEVVLSGIYLKGQAKALNKQKNNMNITNVVAADQVGKFPDANIGDALKRIPGIAMQNDQGEARDIIVRGMAPELNSVTLNGDRIPSAEGDNRRVQMDLIPADMIQTIEVNKAVTPDMEGDAIGGSVNLVTRSAPSGFRASATLGAGTNPIRDNTPVYNFSGIIANRFFNDKLGVVLSTSYNYNKYGSDNVEFEWKKDDSDNPFVNEHDIRIYDVTRIRKSISASLDYDLSADHKLHFKTLFNHRNDYENRYRLTFKSMEDEDGDGIYTAEVRRQTKGGSHDNKNARLENQKMYRLSLGGDHILFDALEADWNVSWARASEKRPNERYIEYEQEGIELIQDFSRNKFPVMVPENGDYNDPALFGLKELTEENQDTKEDNYTARVNFKTALIREGDYASYIKFGYKYNKKKKDRDNDFFEYTSLSGDLENMSRVSYGDHTVSGFKPGGRYVSGNLVDRGFLSNLDLNNGNLFEKEPVLDEYITENYRAEESIHAAYAFIEQDLGKQFSFLAGFRFEHTGIDYTGYTFDEETGETLEDVKAIEESKSYGNFLPNLQLKYKVAENTILRAAFTQTMARPNYYDLVPYQAINSDDAEIAVGNPDLEATKSYNFDIFGEHYFSSVGIVSGGVFYKNLKDYIYTYRELGYTIPGYDGVFEFSQPRNGRDAKVYGFEVAFQRRLNFLPGFLRNLNLYANYTYTGSETNSVEGRDEKTDLAGAVEHMLNSSLSYETDRVSLRMSLNLADDYIDEYGSDTFEDSYYDSQLFLDFNASYAISPKWRIFAEVKNITNQPLRYYQGVKNRTQQVEYYDFNWNIGVKFDF
ncbi:TonB-dependent receptor [Sinomicrobium weinanense]|uniref:TonB-dependent receptor n=1 Tax=Sinomicrobium weinanense TaxID=2842200 RepID=A0A926JNT6_9FLAO|nr:TonB-dependent receptor [Sinomicrobium weinanense]MBC9794614.1 TonB-dependent receptor [Sinomicrobium weinanense]MBU3124099.1 TonB-dependent receptor [Sinomicrobium weinanense]